MRKGAVAEAHARGLHGVILGHSHVAADEREEALCLAVAMRAILETPGRTGALVIGDVGQNAYEEVDYEPPLHGGRNYGWRVREGLHPDVTTSPPAYLPLTDPILDYDHTVGVAVIGTLESRRPWKPADSRA